MPAADAVAFAPWRYFMRAIARHAEARYARARGKRRACVI